MARAPASAAASAAADSLVFTAYISPTSTARPMIVITPTIMTLVSNTAIPRRDFMPTLLIGCIALKHLPRVIARFAEPQEGQIGRGHEDLGHVRHFSVSRHDVTGWED